MATKKTTSLRLVKKTSKPLPVKPIDPDEDVAAPEEDIDTPEYLIHDDAPQPPTNLPSPSITPIKIYEDASLNIHLVNKFENLIDDIIVTPSITITCPDGDIILNKAVLKNTALAGIFTKDTTSELSINIWKPIRYFLFASHKCMNIDHLIFDEIVELYKQTDCFLLAEYSQFLKSYIKDSICGIDNAEKICEIAANDNTYGEVYKFMFEELTGNCLKEFAICFDGRNMPRSSNKQDNDKLMARKRALYAKYKKLPNVLKDEIIKKIFEEHYFKN
jgi:hypothetical protein